MLPCRSPETTSLARHQFDRVDRASALESLTTGSAEVPYLIDPSSEPQNIHLPSLQVPTAVMLSWPLDVTAEDPLMSYTRSDGFPPGNAPLVGRDLQAVHLAVRCCSVL